MLLVFDNIPLFYLKFSSFLIALNLKLYFFLQNSVEDWKKQDVEQTPDNQQTYKFDPAKLEPKFI